MAKSNLKFFYTIFSAVVIAFCLGSFTADATTPNILYQQQQMQEFRIEIDQYYNTLYSRLHELEKRFEQHLEEVGKE